MPDPTVGSEKTLAICWSWFLLYLRPSPLPSLSANSDRCQLHSHRQVFKRRGRLEKKSPSTTYHKQDKHWKQELMSSNPYLTPPLTPMRTPPPTREPTPNSSQKSSQKSSSRSPKSSQKTSPQTQPTPKSQQQPVLTIQISKADEKDKNHSWYEAGPDTEYSSHFSVVAASCLWGSTQFLLLQIFLIELLFEMRCAARSSRPRSKATRRGISKYTYPSRSVLSHYFASMSHLCR